MRAATWLCDKGTKELLPRGLEFLLEFITWRTAHWGGVGYFRICWQQGAEGTNYRPQGVELTFGDSPTQCQQWPLVQGQSQQLSRAAGWLLPGKGTFPAELLFGAEVLQEAAGWMWIVGILQPFIPRHCAYPSFPHPPSRDVNALNRSGSGTSACSSAGR